MAEAFTLKISRNRTLLPLIPQLTFYDRFLSIPQIISTSENTKMVTEINTNPIRSKLDKRRGATCFDFARN